MTDRPNKGGVVSSAKFSIVDADCSLQLIATSEVKALKADPDLWSKEISIGARV